MNFNSNILVCCNVAFKYADFERLKNAYTGINFNIYYIERH